MGLQVRIVLRLDGNPRAQLAKSKAAPQVRVLYIRCTPCPLSRFLSCCHRQPCSLSPSQVDLSKKDGLGNVEEAVLSKYAAADDEDEGEAESGDEEE